MTMSSEDSPTERKQSANETGRETKQIDPKDVEQSRKNIRSNEEERQDSQS
jgi:hypothetical protein